MAKKVLIISSSPRKGGNSDMLCDEFVKGALETGNEVEKIFLKEKAIHPCTGWCGQMKIMIDRCCARYTEITNKEFYFIIAAAENDKGMMERTIDGFRGFLDCLENPQEKGVIYGIGAWKVGEIKDTPYMQEAYEMGKMV